MAQTIVTKTPDDTQITIEGNCTCVQEVYSLKNNISTVSRFFTSDSCLYGNWHIDVEMSCTLWTNSNSTEIMKIRKIIIKPECYHYWLYIHLYRWFIDPIGISEKLWISSKRREYWYIERSITSILWRYY